MKERDRFRERYEAITDFGALLGSISKPLRKSIRVNTLKADAGALRGELKPGWELDGIPWCPEGFWIRDKRGEREDIGNIPQHAEGKFYIQEAASMIPAIVLAPRQGEAILDMCASPGGKTTQIAQYMENTGKLLATDVREDRIAILERNITRMGVANCEVQMKSGQQLRDMRFDRILVDAPCSGTGTMRAGDISGFDPAVPERISGEQKSLLHSAYCLLKKGGLLVYSTCSIDPAENEGAVDYLLKRHRKTNLEEIALQLNRSEPVSGFGGKEFDARVRDCLRLWPQDNNTSGFFVAKIRKLK